MYLGPTVDHPITLMTEHLACAGKTTGIVISFNNATEAQLRKVARLTELFR